MEAYYLQRFRKKTGLNQSDFAKTVGISQSLISRYELGKKTLSVETFHKIKSAFGYFDCDKDRLRYMIDYLRITFKSVRDLEKFTREYLLIPFREFGSYETKLMMYTHLWKRGDIWIFDYHDKFETNNYQITIQLSGSGCRQMEVMLEHYGLTWRDLLANMRSAFGDSMKVTRLDIAIDELYLGVGRENEQFQLEDLISKYYKKELYFDKLRKWNYIGGGSLGSSNNDYEEERQGISIYFGSRQSEMYFNFYEKRYELAKQERITVNEALEVFNIWNRYEIRLAQKKADSIVNEYINGVDLAILGRGLINSRITVYDGTNDYGAYLVDSKWQRLFGGSEGVVISIDPEPYDIRRTIAWLRYQVSNSLALVREFDKIVGEDNLDYVLNSGELTDEAKRTLVAVEAFVRLNQGEYDDCA
ncbi:replication initiation factor domain-containing protein [Streptococcus gallolyticus]|uniref:replication initiation factor domain-containing protein n=1 Tax=Streptococcus gallolyticus TaxID=315405 RepID=UPI002283CE5A|nr:replication initiation factor domain-containing protein [Streptococcus gallolyticus]MCY7179659.1 XRE family transcriptional regulator [Streptococcus gallolyticus subsp. gallolyticus]MCY7195028.1 XRE family transcriptional regulator [Streptococcus gallolyticus subsp. gallolyticus]